MHSFISASHYGLRASRHDRSIEMINKLIEILGGVEVCPETPSCTYLIRIFNIHLKVKRGVFALNGAVSAVSACDLPLESSDRLAHKKVQ